VWTYILRRLLVMIPTLFGVTVVSFCIMQLAPGDPLLAKAGSGMSSQTGQTREAYLIQKRDLKLDKPLVLNFNYFRDYSGSVPLAARYMAASEEEIAAELPGLAAGQGEAGVRRKFLEGLRIPDFAARLADPEQYPALAQAIASYVQVFCEDTASYGAAAAVAMLGSPQADVRAKIGAIRCLNNMVPEPFLYTYSRRPSEAETPAVTATWRTWWRRVEPRFPPLEPRRRAELEKQFAALAAETSWGKLLEGVHDLQYADARFLAEKLLGPPAALPEAAALRVKVVAAMGLRQVIGTPLVADVARDARPRTVQRVAENWLAWYAAHRAEFEPALPGKICRIFTDTQYASMVWRLATFNFGRSAVRTREPVSEKIYAAVCVTAPLMILAELLVYLVAVPLGIVCAVNRNGLIDRGISFVLFLLYSVPPFVAGMLFLLVFCYGDYLRWFPMQGIHSEGAEHLGYLAYTLDYLWHIALPLICLSLFSLAGLAMYGRSAMLEVISQDYIRTARAKGLSPAKVVLKHALRNAMIPIITLFSSFLPAMLGGSVLIEVLFGIPGMGRLNFESILLKDFPTLMAMIYIEAIVVMLSILLTDLLYVAVDPRISFQRQGQSA
jgi:peptide/nickel transport system permease protein